MSAIFISHSSKDNDIAAEVKKKLLEQGHISIFLDFDPDLGIPSGRNWEKELYARLRGSQAVIVLCSEYSMTSPWCFAEITQARSLGKHIFPVKIATCQISPILCDVQVTDLTLNPIEGYQRLWSGLKNIGLDPMDLFDWDGMRPPYPGLLAFQEQDAAIYFGRNAAIQESMDTLIRLDAIGGPRLVMVLGASGSGKSSLVRAGVIPRLKRNKDRWLVLEPFRPLERPLDALAMVLSGAFASFGNARDWKTVRDKLNTLNGSAGNFELDDLANDLRIAAGRRESTVLLVIDQFEELLGQKSDPSAALFIRLLNKVLSQPSSPFLVVCTLRSDFLGAFQSHKALQGLRYEPIHLRQMALGDFAQVIEGPAQVEGFEFDPGLVQAMVADTATDDALPLLAFTLRELYDRRNSNGCLTMKVYREELGGLQGSVARAAEAIFADRTMDADRERHLRKAFLSMVRVDEKGRYARKPAAWNQLPEEVYDFLERCVQARLLVSRGDGVERTLEVAHETLFHSWDRLGRWLEEDRAFLLWHQRLRSHVDEWEGSQHDESNLLRGPALAEAEYKLAERSDDLSQAERTFLEISSALRDRTKRRNRQIALSVISVLSVFLLIALLTSLYAWDKKQLAELATNRALMGFSKALSLQAQTENTSDTPIISLLLAREAVQMHSARENLNIMDEIVSYFEDERTLMVPGLEQATVSSDGKWIAYTLPENLVLQPIDGSSSPVRISLEAENDNNYVNLSFSISPTAVWIGIAARTSSKGTSFSDTSYSDSVQLWKIDKQRHSPHNSLTLEYNYKGPEKEPKFALSDKYFVSTCNDDSANLCIRDLANSDMAQRDPIRLNCQGIEIKEVRLSDSDNWLLALQKNNSVCFWNLSTLTRDKPTAIINNPGRLNLVDIDMQGNRVVLASEKEGFACELKDDKPHCKSFFRIDGKIASLKLSPAGEFLAYVAYDKEDDSHAKKGFTLTILDVSNGKTLYSYYEAPEDNLDHYIDSRPFFLPKYGLVGYEFSMESKNATRQIKLLSGFFEVGEKKEKSSLFRIIPKEEIEERLNRVKNEVGELPVKSSNSGELLIFGGRVRLVFERDYALLANNKITLTDVRSGKTHPYILDDALNSIIIIRDRYLVATKGSIQGSGGFSQSESRVLLFDLSNLGGEPRVLLSYSGETFESLSSSAGDQQKLAILRSDGTVFVYDTNDFSREPVMLQADIDLASEYSSELQVLFSPEGRYLNLGVGIALFRWDLEMPGQIPQIFHTQNLINEIYNENEMGDILLLSEPYNGGEEKILLGLDHRFFSDTERRSWLLEKTCTFPLGRNLTKVEWNKYFGEIPYRKTCDNWYAPHAGDNLLN
jgi:hypothetical protein